MTQLEVATTATPTNKLCNHSMMNARCLMSYNEQAFGVLPERTTPPRLCYRDFTTTYCILKAIAKGLRTSIVKT